MSPACHSEQAPATAAGNQPERERPHHIMPTEGASWLSVCFPSSSGEKRMLRLAASLAGDIPVRLGDAVTGIDGRNVSLLVNAVLHASGQRQFPR